MKNVLLVIVLVLIYGCAPLHTNSIAFKNVQSGLLETNKTMHDMAIQIDHINEKLGVHAPKLSLETVELVKQIQADNAKTYNALMETISTLKPLIKTGLEIGATAVGVPQPIAKGVINTVDALIYGGSTIATTVAGGTLWARRRDKKKFADEIKDWEKYDKENDRKNQIKIRANALTSPNSTTEYQKNLVLAEKQLIDEGVIS